MDTARDLVMNTRKNGWSIYLLTVILVFALFSTAAAGEEVLKIGGSGSALGAMRLLGAAFMRTSPGVDVQVLLGLGSTGGIKAVAKGTIDIGLSGRPLKDEEPLLKLSVRHYGTTPFVLATRRESAAGGVTTEELVKIYGGETTTWPDGSRIRLVLREPFESDTLTARKISPEMGRALDSALARKGQLIATTDQDTADLIEATPGGFGFSTLALLSAERRPLKILSFNGVAPGLKTLADGTYPLSKPLYLVVRPEPSALVKKFISFMDSPQGRKILEGAGILVVNK